MRIKRVLVAVGVVAAFGCEGAASLDTPLAPDEEITILDAAPPERSPGLRADGGAPDATELPPDAAVAPEDAAPTPDAAPDGDRCGDTRAVPAVHYGSYEPTYLSLSPSQMLALGMWVVDGGRGFVSYCSGAIIAPRYVLTAKHCAIPAGTPLWVGESSTPDQQLTAARWLPHPTLDIALVELTTDATVTVPGLTPIPIVLEDIGPSWVGARTEACGFGETETGSIGARKFTALPIRSLDSQFIYVDGMGREGVCGGDSGGPLMAIDVRGDVRVIGAVSGGDGTCTYEAHFTRADMAREFVEGYTGPTPLDGRGGCGDLDGEGRCIDGNAVYCSDEHRQIDTCESGEACGWDVASAGYRCVPEATSRCEGLDTAGVCDGLTARWCDRGELRERNCGTCGEACSDDSGLATCVPDGCDGIDFLGECQEAVAVWCEEGVLKQRDCGAEGRTCGFVDEETGYFCQ